MNRDINKQIQWFNELVNKTSSATDNNLELQAEWARYLCVISAGILENAIKILYTEYANKQISTPIANFISSTLSPIRNPKPQRFLDISAAFNTVWKDELEIFINDNGRFDAIDSIMNQRHLVAHGKYKNSGITMSRIKEYFAKAVEVLEFIEQQCEK